MRIGFFTDRYYPQVDGVAVSVDLFAKELRKLGHEVFIFCPQGTPKQKNEPSYIVRFRSFPSIWYEDYRDTFPFTPAVIRKVESYNLDLVHIHTPALIGMLGIRIARDSNLPLIATHHTDIEQYIKVYKRIMLGFVTALFVTPALMRTPKLYRSAIQSLKPNRSIRQWNKNIIRKNLKALYDNCQLVIAPSRKMEDLLKAYQVKTQLEVLPTGIDPAETELPSDYDPREELGIPKDAPLLLFVGRLGEEKNIQLILRAMLQILENHPETQLLLVGDGPYREDLEQLSEELDLRGNINFTGMLSRGDTFNCFKTADMFVFPSTTDTQGLVINEAGFEAKPIVYIDDMISPITINGVTGIKSHNTARSLAQAITKLIEKPELRRKYGQAARTEAKKITIAKQAHKLIQLYKSVI